MWAVIHLIAWVAIVILTISAFSIYPKITRYLRSCK
ncbi:Uncharacterised protein [Listeria grayi]|uniref:Uncharacterized protein n=1 Tax=Listeria grayi TaxID=1641 RepID=A0A378MF58_LISGR|nr:Uncharacterised protein [Listeria grayi]